MTHYPAPDTPLFAVRTGRHRYAVRHPDTGAPVDRDAAGLPQGWLEPVLLPHALAMELAAVLSAQTAEEWVLEPQPQPCPNCGRQLLVDDLDWVYPRNRERTKWRAGCNEHDFGCGYEVVGASEAEVLEKWNAGAPHDGQANEFVEKQRTALLKLPPEVAAALPLPLVLQGPRVLTVDAVPGVEAGVVSLAGSHTSPMALVRQGCRALRAHLGTEAALEVISCGEAEGAAG